MRVISGDHKGRKLKPVPGKMTRPTSDKVKESLFHMIGPYFNGGSCLDLFAGSGSLGIEAISRGIEYCVFIDKHPLAIRTIKENVQSLKLEDKCTILKMDAFKSLHILKEKEHKFDLLLIDPPYEKIDYHRVFQLLMKDELLNEGAIVVCEHNEHFDPNEIKDPFILTKQANYGKTRSLAVFTFAINNF